MHFGLLGIEGWVAPPGFSSFSRQQGEQVFLEVNVVLRSGAAVNGSFPTPLVLMGFFSLAPISTNIVF